ncbi:MAG: glutathione S-transferase N-terminal domain-containing protein [Alphaproteobacteria bacterium]|nr:glutathione S-transferase N-terminal domain-containing protein [Alphaproteobacteria bacterium]
MIEAYVWTTGNNRKVLIMLEETGLPYRVHPVNIHEGAQFAPDYGVISPNHKTPAIVDTDGPGGAPMPLFESGAILHYLAEKTGRFLPEDGEPRYRVIEWLMWQMGGIGPMFGQVNHFMARKEDPAMGYALERYHKESLRLLRVLDDRLEGRDYIAGDYSIADMATFPWCQGTDWRAEALPECPNVRRWMERIAERPAVERAQAVTAELRKSAA